MLAAVAVAGGSGSPTPHVYALTLGAQADALGLTGTQFAAPTATKNGVSIAITGYAWTVTGPCTLDDDAIAQPTPTHTGAGIVTRQLTATLADGAVVASAMDGWRVGDTSGLVTTYAPDLAAVASADWRSGGPGFTVGGVTWTVRNQSTFSTGVLGPDGSTGIRLKPSSTGVDWVGATATAGGLTVPLADCIPGLGELTELDVVFALRCDSDTDAAVDVICAALTDGPFTATPRGGRLVRFHNGASAFRAVERATASGADVQSGGAVVQVAAIRGVAFRARGMTITPYWITSEVTSLPDVSFTGWSSLAPFAVDAGLPNAATAWTVSALTASILAFLAGAPAVGLDITLTGLWVRAKV